MNNKDIRLNIHNYDGPFDLLLDLVKEKKMDIFDIDLYELASQYLKIIETLKNTNIDLASEYLVVAASLIQLKSKMLLENPDDREEVEMEKKDVLKQLINYQQFKKVGEKLKQREKSRTEIYIKEPEDYKKYEKPTDETKLDGTSSPIKLMIQMRKLFERMNAMHLRETRIEKFNLSPTERRVEILELISEKKDITFKDIFSVPSMNHFVVTMITVLDMARKQELILEQDGQFEEIYIKKGVIND